MKRWRIILISAAVTLVLLALLPIAFWPDESEPEYQGKKLSEWLQPQPSNVPDQTPPEVIEAVRAIGTNALPCLVKWISFDGARIQSIHDRLPRWIRSTRIPRYFLGMRRSVNAGHASDAFGILGASASPAVPDLVAMLRQPCSFVKTYNVTSALAAIGRPALVPILEILADKQSSSLTRSYICGMLSNMAEKRELGPAIATAVPVLAQCAKQTNLWVVLNSANALGSIGTDPDVSVPALITAARFPDARVQRSALHALGQFGTNANASLPIVIQALNDPDTWTRTVARVAAERIAPEVFKTNSTSAKHE
jgi:HEAT repeat protein